MNKKEFIDNCRKIKIHITDEIYDKLYKYYELLNEWNNKFNLTNILEEDSVFLLHFYDSLCLSNYINLKEKCSLCDFGSGAGFPGMVIAIIFSNVNVTLIESNHKKCLFLNQIKKELSISNVNIICTRIEEYAIKNREIFDYVTCRAVTSLPIIVELATSTIKVGGLLAPLKSNCDDEILNYEKLYNEFYLELISNNKYKLPIQNSNRSIPIFKKYKKTNMKYPRKYNKILNNYKK